MSTPASQQPRPEMREPLSGVHAATPPPPAYQDNINNSNTNRVGETYYQPPPPPSPMSYPLPPVLEPHDTPAIGTRIAEFYSPQDNKRLATRRRLSSCLCILITIAIIVGLASGLTRNAYYDNCECQSNADCSRLYGANVYCSNSCECVARY